MPLEDLPSLDGPTDNEACDVQFAEEMHVCWRYCLVKGESLHDAVMVAVKMTVLPLICVF